MHLFRSPFIHRFTAAYTTSINLDTSSSTPFSFSVSPLPIAAHTDFAREVASSLDDSPPLLVLDRSYRGHHLYVMDPPPSPAIDLSKPAAAAALLSDHHQRRCHRLSRPLFFYPHSNTNSNQPSRQLPPHGRPSLSRIIYVSPSKKNHSITTANHCLYPSSLSFSHKPYRARPPPLEQAITVFSFLFSLSLHFPFALTPPYFLYFLSSELSKPLQLSFAPFSIKTPLYH